VFDLMGKDDKLQRRPVPNTSK